MSATCTFTILTGLKTVAGSIKHFTNYSRIDSTVVLADTQALLYSLLRVTEMKSLATLTLAIGDTTESIPTGFLDPQGGITGSDGETYAAFDTDGNFYGHVPEMAPFLQQRTFTSGVINSAQPQYFCIYDNVINFEHKFDTARTIYLPYYKTLTALSASNESNFLTDRYPHVLRQACHVQSHAFMKNWSAYNAELPLLTSLIERCNQESDLMFRGGNY